MTVASVISFYDCDLLAANGAFPTCVLVIFYLDQQGPEGKDVLTCGNPTSSCLRRPPIVLAPYSLSTRSCHGGQGWVFLRFLSLQFCRIPEFHPHMAPSPNPSHRPTHPLAPSTTTHGSGEIHNHTFCTILPLGERAQGLVHTVGTG